MDNINLSAAAVFGGLLLANFGVLIGAYVKVGRLESDVRNLANMIKQSRKD